MALSLAFTTWVDAPGTPSTPGASDLNRIQANDEFFARKPIVSLARTVEQALHNTTESIIAYNLDAADPDAMHAEGGTDIVCTVPGWYLVMATVTWANPVATGVGLRRISLYRNGVLFGRDDRQANPVNTTTQTITTLLDLRVGNVVTVGAIHAQGSPLSILGNSRVENAFHMTWQRNL